MSSYIDNLFAKNIQSNMEEILIEKWLGQYK
jgi:hypothetical protein